MKEQRSEDAKEFLVLVIAVTHELFSCMEISQWARGSIVLSTMNEAEKHLASKHIYAYLLQLFQDGSRHSIRATHM
ncbi:Lipopolysaccharide core biosynthesis glycosyltransferase LpsE [Trichinella spiralis]